MTIHATERVPLPDVPAGAEFKGYRPFVVQDWVIRPHNTRDLLENWRLPSGEYGTAPVPAVRGGHYGPQLISYVLHQIIAPLNKFWNRCFEPPRRRVPLLLVRGGEFPQAAWGRYTTPT